MAQIEKESVVPEIKRETSPISGKTVLLENTGTLEWSILNERLNWLKSRFSARNTNVGKMRDYYQGEKLIAELEGEGLKLVVNEVSRIIDTYVDFMAIPADFQVPPPYESDEARGLADKIEKLLYSQWNRNSQGILTQEMNFNLISFGVTPIYIHPATKVDIDLGTYIRIIVPRPENAYFVPDGVRRFSYSEVFYIEKKINIEIKREFKVAEYLGSDYDETEVIYYWNKNWYAVIVKEKIVKSVKHNWGIVPWVYIPNRAYPLDITSKGETDNAVALVKYMNELLSDLADIVNYYANPTVIGVGTGMSRSDWQMGGFNEIRTGGDVKFLEWAGRSQIELKDMLREIRGFIEEQTGNASMPQSTGARGAKQVMAMMMPFDVRLNSKRLIEAEALSVLNRYMLQIIEKTYGSDELFIRGTKKGQSFSMHFTPKQIKSYYDNNIVWSPGPIDYTQRVVRALQLVGAGLMSKYTGREMLGISSPKDEAKRVYDEKMEELAIQMKLMKKMQPPTPTRPATEAEIVGAEEGGETKPERTKPGRPRKVKGTQIEAEGAPVAAEERAAPVVPEGEEAAPAVPIAGSELPEEGKEEAKEEILYLNDVTAAMSKVAKLKGSVYVFGGLVLDGQTSNDIDIALTDMIDKATLVRGLPQYAGRMKFKKLEKGKEPEGNFIAVNVAKPKGK